MIAAIVDRVAALGFCFALLLLAYYQRRRAGSWGTPGIIFSVFWSVMITIPVLALPSMPIDPFAIFYIFLACTAFSLPGIVRPWGSSFASNAALAPSRHALLHNRFITMAFLGAVLTSLACITIDVAIQGFRPADFAQNFFVHSNELLARKYEGAIVYNVFSGAALVGAYVAAILGGLVHASAAPGSRRKIVLALSLISPLMLTLVTGTKGTLLLSGAFLLGSHWLYRVLTDRRPHIDPLALARTGAKAAILLIPVFTVSFLQRGLYNVTDQAYLVGRVAGYFKVYAFGHIYGWSDWFSFMTGRPARQSYESLPAQSGYYTFGSAFDLVGKSQEVPSGLYSEYLRVGDQSFGNIYTIYRGLVIDFGIAGSLVVVLALGFVFTWAFELLLKKRISIWAFGALIMFVNVTYSSPFISAFIWHTTWAVPLVVMALLAVNSTLERRSSRLEVAVTQDGRRG